MSDGKPARPDKLRSDVFFLAGKASNAPLMIGCFLFLIIGLSGMGVGMEMSPNTREGFGRVVMVAYWVFAGGLCGAVVWAIRLRVCTFVWNEDGFSFRVGWKKAVWHRFSWTDPVESFSIRVLARKAFCS